MSIAQERTIRNYIYQMRTAFSLQEVHENTDIPKTSAFRIIHKLLENGEIEKTGASVSPQRYKAVIRVAKSPKGDFDKRADKLTTIRQEEVADKAKELGVSTRTVYRIEKRVAEGKEADPFAEVEESYIYPYMKTIVAEAYKIGKISIDKTAELMGCDENQARGILQHMEVLELVRLEDKEYIPLRRIS